MSDEEFFVGRSGRKYKVGSRLHKLIMRAQERNSRELTDEELAEAKEWEEGLPLAGPLPTGAEKFAVFVPRSGKADEDEEEDEDGDNVAAGRE